jgi:hypothetical protein
MTPWCPAMRAHQAAVDFKERQGTPYHVLAYLEGAAVWVLLQ